MRKITSQKAVFLQFSEGSAVSREICFGSTTKALEFYFNNTLAHPKGIDYEKKLEKVLTAAASAPLHSGEWLDVHVTIGLYLNRLGWVQKLILAYFYGGAGAQDDKIAQALNQRGKEKNYTEEIVKDLRIKALRFLKKHFIRIGIVSE